MTTATAGLGSRILDSIRRGDAPRTARLAAARGALPLAPAELILLQILLVRDDDLDVRAAAESSLAEVEPGITASIASDPETDALVLGWIAESYSRWPDAARSVAESARVAPEALLPLASCAVPGILDALAANQRALSRLPRLGEILRDNPSLRRETHARLLDFLDEVAKRPQEVIPEVEPEPAETGLARDPFLASLGIDAELEALLPELDIDIGALAERSELLGGLEDGDDKSLIARIAGMKVGQKLKLALFGSREERSVLIRDTNRIVATSVVKNPKFSETEAESVSNSRNVNDEVLRLVARHREYGQIYSIRHNLVRNPRCPAEVSMRLVATLRELDLKLLVRNRNVSEPVRRQAKKLIEILQQRRRVRVGHKK